MGLQTPPYVISAATHSAALFRQAMDAPFARRGAMGVGEYAVTQQATANMSVQVGAGRAMIPGTLGVTPSPFTWSTQGSYLALNDGAATVTLAASNASNPRIDVVYVAVQDAFYSGSNNQAVLGVATGVASASPAVPAIPSNAIALATIAVGANVSSIVAANISQTAGLATTVAMSVGSILPVTGTSAYPANPYVGQYIDDAALGLLRWGGSAIGWLPVGGAPPQYAAVTAASGYSSSVSVARFGGIVMMNGQLTKNSGSVPNSGSAATLGTIPNGFFPPNSVRVTVYGFSGTDGSQATVALQIASNGAILGIANNANTSTLYLTGVSWPYQ